MNNKFKNRIRFLAGKKAYGSFRKLAKAINIHHSTLLRLAAPASTRKPTEYVKVVIDRAYELAKAA